MKKIVFRMILVLMFTGGTNAKIMKKMSDVEKVLSRSVVTPALTPIAMPKVDQEAIKKRLDEQLSSPVESKWDDSINDLFDLAMVNRELARDYFIKMRSTMESAEIKPAVDSTLPVGEEPMKKATGRPAPPRKPAAPKVESSEAAKTEVTETTLPAGEEPMKKATGRPAPTRKPAAPKVESIEAPSGEEPMKKSATPAPKKGAPSGGPAKNIGGSVKPGVTKPGATKIAASKVVEQVFSKSKLEQLDNDKLLELFNDLLEKLGTVGTNWNSTIVEKIEEKTKYGQKMYNVYGAPVAKWKNDIDTLKRVLVSKNVMLEAEITNKINDRIAQVRAEKTVKPAVQPEVEKPKEELTENDLVKQIKAQLAKPKADQIGWVVSIKGNIKALDKLNHTSAMQYHDQFIKVTKEKPFLK